MNSLWAEGLTQKYAPLAGDTRAQVAIVGGSFAGLATAEYLMSRGYRDIAIVDADVIGVQGGRAVGLVVSSTEDDYLGLEQEQGADEANELWKFNVDAVEGVKGIIKKEKLGCVDGRGSRYLMEAEEKDYLRDEARARKNAGFNSRFGKSDVNMNDHEFALTTPDDVTIDPTKYLAQLAESLSRRGCKIYEKTRVTGLDKKEKKLATKDGSITADNIVLAGQRVPKMFGYNYGTVPMETYFLVTEPMTKEQIESAGLEKRQSFWNGSDNYVYGRMAGNRLVFGGEYLLRPLAPIFRERKLNRLENRFRESFPQLADVAIEQKFAGPIDTTIDEMPVVDNPEHGIYTIGASEGIAAATTGGRVVADMIAGLEPENPYEPRSAWELTKMVANNPWNFAKIGAYALGY